MRTKILTASFLLLMVSALLVETAQAGMVRVAKRYSVLDFLGGYSKPVGTFDGIGIIDFTNSDGSVANLDADQVYDPSFHLGLRYGQLRNNHMLYALGLRYTSVKEVDSFFTEGQFFFFDPKDPTVSQVDLDFNFNYLFTNITTTFLAPYIGVGFRAGLTSFSGKGVETQSELNIATAVNAGVEVRLWQVPKGRSFVTLAPFGSYEFYVSGNRPRFFNIGLGVKYYYRM